jgi:hypothetical protein
VAPQGSGSGGPPSLRPVHDGAEPGPSVLAHDACGGLELLSVLQDEVEQLGALVPDHAGDRRPRREARRRPHPPAQHAPHRDDGAFCQGRARAGQPVVDLGIRGRAGDAADGQVEERLGLADRHHHPDEVLPGHFRAGGGALDLLALYEFPQVGMAERDRRVDVGPAFAPNRQRVPEAAPRVSVPPEQPVDLLVEEVKRRRFDLMVRHREAACAR